MYRPTKFNEILLFAYLRADGREGGWVGQLGCVGEYTGVHIRNMHCAKTIPHSFMKSITYVGLTR